LKYCCLCRRTKPCKDLVTFLRPISAEVELWDCASAGEALGQKQPYSSGENQSDCQHQRLVSHKTIPWQRNSLKFFFLNKFMKFPTCGEIEKKSRILKIIFKLSLTRQGSMCAEQYLAFGCHQWELQSGEHNSSFRAI